MRVMSLARPGDARSAPLELRERSTRAPETNEVLVRVEACGVCRTDLHVVEGDLPERRSGIVPGHEIVGRVVAVGPCVTNLATGTRVGVAWLHRSCGICRFCQRGAENLCLTPIFTGWDVDGGYADEVIAFAEFVYALPEEIPATDLAPLLCAGIIGYRAYARSGIRAGGRLGLYGFGGSAHIVIQLARHQGCEVYVFSRGGAHREHALELGAAWVGDSFERPPRPLDAAILFAPAGEIVPAALASLDRGATLAVAGIHLTDVPPLDYQRHLFQERALASVTANTREDGRALLRLAAEIPIRTRTRVLPLASANDALLDLKEDRIRGAAVLVP